MASIRVTPVVFQLSRQTLHSHNAVFDLRSLQQRDSQGRIRFERFCREASTTHIFTATLFSALHLLAKGALDEASAA